MQAQLQAYEARYAQGVGSVLRVAADATIATTSAAAAKAVQHLPAITHASINAPGYLMAGAMVFASPNQNLFPELMQQVSSTASAVLAETAALGVGSFATNWSDNALEVLRAADNSNAFDVEGAKCLAGTAICVAAQFTGAVVAGASAPALGTAILVGATTYGAKRALTWVSNNLGFVAYCCLRSGCCRFV